MKASSADALAELRSTLRLLRPAAGEAPMRPLQSLENLPELIDGVGLAGLQVELQVAALPWPVPTTTAHAAYRIVQEALTNVLRHSSTTQATVDITPVAGALTVQIVDAGRPGHPTAGTAGHGVRGMAERAAALGGHCDAGPLAGGGWRVAASLPVTAGTA